MEILIKARFLDRERRGVSIDLAPEFFDHSNRSWADLHTEMKKIGVAVKVTRRNGIHSLSFNHDVLSRFFPSGFLPTFRLTLKEHAGHSELEKESGTNYLFSANPEISYSGKRTTIDFGEILVLGLDHGYISKRHEKVSDFILGVSASKDPSAFKKFSDSYFKSEMFQKEIQGLQQSVRTANEALKLCKNESRKTIGLLKKRETELKAVQKSVEKTKADVLKQQKLASRLTQNLNAKNKEIEKFSTRLKSCQDAQVELKNSLRDCRKKHSALEVKFRSYAERLEKAEKLSEQYLKQKANLEQALKVQQSRSKQADEKLKACSELNRKLRAEIVEKARENQKLKVKLQDLTAKFEKKNKESDAQSRTLAKLKAQTQIQDSKIVELETEVRDGQKQIDTKVSQIEILENRLLKVADGENQLATRTSELRNQLASKSAELDISQRDLKALRGQIQKEVEVKDVLARIGQDASAAAASLADAGLPYKLGKINMNIKAIIGSDGTKMMLPDAAISTQDAAVSSIDLELLPDETIFSANAINELLAPNLLGLTESAVNTQLRSLGLKLKPSNMPVAKDSKDKNGRALRQSPASGESVSKGQYIRVTFGRIFSEAEA